MLSYGTGTGDRGCGFSGRKWVTVTLQQGKEEAEEIKIPNRSFFLLLSLFPESPIGLDSTEAGEQGCPSDRA